MNQSEKREVLKLYTWHRMGAIDLVARTMALIQVRTVLSHSIDNGEFFHA